MKYIKSINSYLVIVILMIGTYTVMSTLTYQKKIRSITTEMNIKINELDSLRNNYDSILIKYTSLTYTLENTKEHLQIFKNDLDSIRQVRKQSLSQINHALKLIIEEQDSLIHQDSTLVSFRLL